MGASFEVVFTPDAEAQLVDIHAYIAWQSSHAIADRFVEGIVKRCESLANFPHRGTPHDDLRRGLRTIPYRRRATIGYIVDEDIVLILAIAYAGREISGLAMQ